MTNEERLIREAADATIDGNWDLAISLFTEAYELGSGCAAFNLSEMYKTGMGVERDHEKQQYWLDEANALGFKPKHQTNPESDALFYQAVDASIAQDWALAISLYNKAAELGNGTAAFNLSEMYKSGKGVEQDDEKQQYWFNRAKEMGYKPKPEGAFRVRKRENKPKPMPPKKPTLLSRIVSLFSKP